jgi:carboxyl-terminal processing protease
MQRFFEISVQLIEKRIDEAEQYYQEILASPFDFTKKEEIQLDDEKNEFAKNTTELRDSWRKALKYQTLLEINTKMDIQEQALEDNDTTVEQRSFAELEEAARQKSS